MTPAAPFRSRRRLPVTEMFRHRTARLSLQRLTHGENSFSPHFQPPPPPPLHWLNLAAVDLLASNPYKLALLLGQAPHRLVVDLQPRQQLHAHEETHTHHVPAKQQVGYTRSINSSYLFCLRRGADEALLQSAVHTYVAQSLFY